MITLYNSLSRKKEQFVPIDENIITIYNCGITAHDSPHLGNARPAVVFDVLNRILKRNYKEVRYVRNFTDVDDKIITRAAALSIEISELTNKVISEYTDDMKYLNCLPPTLSPKATNFIGEMIGMIQILIDKNHAYLSEGNVLFSIDSYKGHGKLSLHDRKDLLDGVRIENNSYKKNAGDFILWKPAMGAVGWPSPWGFGRPGWHIECSAMIRSILGNTIDIHAGGGDLRFPHHECEKSQSECVNNEPLANYWMHNGMLLVDGKKMSKSDNNFVTIRSLNATGFSGDAVRLSLLQTHYRSPLDWNVKMVIGADRVLSRWQEALRSYRDEFESIEENDLLDSLYDDLNTPEFITKIHESVNKLTTRNVHEASKVYHALQFLGFLQHGFKEQKMSEFELDIFNRRETFRKNKDYKESDRLRHVLAELDIFIKDTKDGAIWWRNR